MLAPLGAARECAKPLTAGRRVQQNVACAPIDELNLNADYQLVNGGRGLLEVYALGRRTESHNIGELAMRTLAVALENLDDNRAQQLV